VLVISGARAGCARRLAQKIGKTRRRAQEWLAAPELDLGRAVARPANGGGRRSAGRAGLGAGAEAASGAEAGDAGGRRPPVGFTGVTTGHSVREADRVSRQPAQRSEEVAGSRCRRPGNVIAVRSAKVITTGPAKVIASRRGARRSATRSVLRARRSAPVSPTRGFSRRGGPGADASTWSALAWEGGRAALARTPVRAPSGGGAGRAGGAPRSSGGSRAHCAARAGS
jgi:hypothetical protein